VQCDGHVVLNIRVLLFGVVDAGDGGVPAVQLSGDFGTGECFFAALAGTGEHVGRDRLRFVGVEWPVAGIAVRLDGGGDLRRSPRSFSGYSRTAASVVSTPKFLSYSESFG
jgi:hypothetical protein